MASESKLRTGRKRGNNEGSIYHREDGRWCAQVTLPNGKRKYLYGKTRKEVVVKLTAASKAVHDGLPVTTGQATVSGFLTRWLEDAARPSVKPSTYAGYRNIVRNHIVPHIGKIPLGKLSPQDVQRLLIERSRANLSPRTVQLIRAVLRRALGQAVKWRVLAYNPAQFVDPPKQRRYTSTVWTPEETRRFLAATQDDRFGALYAVAAYLSLRQGEILAIRWQDVEFDRKTLSVNGSMPTVGTRVRGETKTERSCRVLPLPEPVAAALRTHRLRQLEERLRAGDEWRDHDLVFANVFGGPVERKGLHYRFKKAIVQAGVPEIRFHDLRHGCATFLLAQKVPARVVSDILGHSSIKTTMDLYAHVMPHLLEDAAATMERLLG
jgi:integrase